MPLWKYLPNFIKGEPTDLPKLRLHQDHKTREFYKEGKFWFTPEAKDGQAVLLVSSKASTDIKDKYLALAAPKTANNFITGTYASGEGGGKAFYKLTTDAKYTSGQDAAAKKVYDQIVKSPDFEKDLRSCLGMANPTVLSVDGKELSVIKKSKIEWVVCDWNLTTVLVAKKGQGPTTYKGEGSKLEVAGDWVYLDEAHKQKKWITPGGLEFPEKIDCKVIVYGDVVEVGKKDELLQWFRDPVTDAMVEKMEELKVAIEKIDKDAAKEALPKAKAKKSLEEALEKFKKGYEEACLEGVSKRYFEVVADKIELKMYQFETKVAMAKAAIGVTIGIAATAATPFTGGATAILGIIGLCKSGTELFRDFYQYKRGIEGLEKELAADIARTYARYVLETDKKMRTGFEEVGKAFLEKLPGLGILVNDVLKIEGTKTVDALEKNLNHYKPKVTESFGKLQKLLKQIEPLMQQTAKEAQRFNTLEWKTWEVRDLESKRLAHIIRNSHTQAEKALDDLLVLIAGTEKTSKRAKSQGLFKQYAERKDLVEKFKGQVDGIKKAVPVQAKVFNAAVMPLLDLTWGGIDPANVPQTVMASVSGFLDSTTGIIGALDAAGNKTEGAKLAKLGNDYANGFREFITQLKAK